MIEKILASEDEGVHMFGKFELTFESQYLPSTIIEYGEFLIASAKDNYIHIFSKEHCQYRTF